MSCKDDIGSMDYFYSQGDQCSSWKKCGHCEDNMAAVNCHQCDEVYCAKRFAAFHLNVALRKHRSIPLSILPNGGSFLPSFPSKPASRTKSNNASRNNTEHLDSKEKKKPTNDGCSFAKGNYDEDLSSHYFQDAIMAWRNGDDAQYEPKSLPQRILTESSTETHQMDGKYRYLADTITLTPSLSYSEQLLLIKHRSCQLLPVEMKYILNMLTRNNEAELIENQRLLLAYLNLEMSAISTNLDNGLLTDNQHFEIGILAHLLSTADVFDDKEQLHGTSPLGNSHFEIKELVSLSENGPQDFFESQ